MGSGLIKTYLQKYQADKAGMTPDDIKILQALRKQGLEFSKHGRNKGKIADYNPIYDYGGSGTFADTPENRLGYKNVVMKMFDDQLNRASSGDIYHMLENWRGPTKPELLQDYISKVEDYYYNPIEYTVPDIPNRSLEAIKRGIKPAQSQTDMQINEIRKSLNIK